MRQPLQLVIGLLACLALASASPGLFPRKNVTTYKYYADVKTGNIEPVPYASQFVITGHLHVKPEARVPNVKNAYYIVLDVNHAIRNGEIQHFEKISEKALPIPDAAKVLNEPFIVIFDDNGKVKSVMVNEYEAGWSRNMKQSIASMLQLDLSAIQLKTPMVPHAFLTKENTVYGECVVAYDVHHTVGLEEKYFTVTKNMEPMSCTKFNQHTFNSKTSGGCLVESEEEMTSASRRVFQIENTGEDLLIKTLVAHGVINYFPWRAKSEAHYVLANQTLELDSTAAIESISLPELHITEMVTLNDITFKKSESLYAAQAGVDYSYGRHVINPGILHTKLMRMLSEAVDYMNENHLEMTSPEMKHGQTINRILLTMSRMDLPSLEHVFNVIIDGTNQQDATKVKNLFLYMIPYVGTNATCLFTRNIIRKQKIPDSIAITILAKLPHNIRVNSDSLLTEMEVLLRLGNDTSLEVRKAGILAFATMIYKTHAHESYRRIMESESVRKYVKYYYDQVISEPTYEMKMVYLHALRNVEIGDSHKLLEPIIRGELELSDKPEYLRMHAMMSNWRRGHNDVEYIYKLYWPILSNTKLSLGLRGCAYTILIEQQPRMERLMDLYWLMVYEKNDHLYNFHYTYLVSLANAKDSCLAPLKEMARKLLRFTKVRPTSGIMSGAWRVDFENKKFGFGDSLGVVMAADELTGAPHLGVLEYTSLNHRRAVNDFGVWLRVEGVSNFDTIIRNMTSEKPNIPLEKIQNVLNEASGDMPEQKPIHIEYCLVIQGRAVTCQFFDKLPDTLTILAMAQTEMGANFNWQSIEFDELYTMQVSNDLGLPTLFHNNIPRVFSLKTSNEITSKTSTVFGMRFETVFKDWRHGFHSMEVYNPIADSWHAIRRVSAYDVSLPIAMSISYNLETKTLKLNLPRLPETEYSVSGIRSHAKNYVMIMEAGDGVLERYCGSDCSSAEIITKGAEHKKNTTLMNLDSKDTGLRFSMYQYDCERVILPRSRMEKFAEILGTDDKNTWDNDAILSIMTFRELYLQLLINPEAGTCGYLARLEPSTMYPTSEIDINMRMNQEVPASKMMSLLPATRINLRGTLEARAVGSNNTVQSWTMNANMGTSQGFINNQLQVQLTRETPGQTDYKICIDGYKIYPALEVDPLNRDSTIKQEVIGKLTITMGESENGTCVRDDVSVMISMKAEMSSEQKEELDREMANGLCKKDIENPNYLYKESSIVPRTLTCLHEALLRTTLRKYTYTVIYKNIPESITPTLHWLAADFRCELLGDVTYLPAHTEPGIIKIFAEYPLNNDFMNLIIRNPYHEEKYTNITSLLSNGYTVSGSRGMNYIVHQPFVTGLTNLDYGITNPLLENTRFTHVFRGDLENKGIKFCSIYPDILLNADGAVMDFTVPDQWTLLTADYVGHMFSVFVKGFESKKLGLLMSIRNHTIQVIPSATIPTVTVDGDDIDYVNGVTIPDVSTSSYAVRITWSHHRLVFQSTYTSFDLEWTERSVTLAMKVSLQGKVTGLCGHLDGTHTEHMAKVYSFGE